MDYVLNIVYKMPFFFIFLSIRRLQPPKRFRKIFHWGPGNWKVLKKSWIFVGKRVGTLHPPEHHDSSELVVSDDVMVC